MNQDTRQRQLSRLAQMDPENKHQERQAKKALERTLNAQNIVRRSPMFSFETCDVFGPLVKKTKSGMSYKCLKTGKTKNVRNAKPKYSGSRAEQVVHTEICPFCPEKRDPRACLHGKIGWCETCAST